MLPEPRSLEENNFLANFLSGNGWLFLGMTDRVEEDKWIWESDGTEVTWTHWLSGQPGGGTAENCAFIYHNRWVDYTCVKSALMREGKVLCEGIFISIFYVGK